MKEHVYSTNILSDVMQALEERDRGIDANYWHRRLRDLGVVIMEGNSAVDLVEIGKQDERGLPSISLYAENANTMLSSIKFENYEMLLGFADGYIRAKQLGGLI